MAHDLGAHFLQTELRTASHICNGNSTVDLIFKIVRLVLVWIEALSRFEQAQVRLLCLVEREIGKELNIGLDVRYNVLFC